MLKLLLALLLPITAQAAVDSHQQGNLVAHGLVRPSVTGQDMNSASYRWDFWVATLNTNLGEGVPYINSSGNLAVDTTVSPAELGYIGTLSSNAQDQINSKLAASAASAFGLTLIDDADAATARATIGLGIGTNVQAWDAQLDSLSAASANGVSLITAADYAAIKALLDLEIGTDVQAYDADLAAIAALSGTDTFYYRSASNTWTAVTVGSGLDFTSGVLSAAGGAAAAVKSAQFMCGTGNADSDTELLLTFETGSLFQDYSTNDYSDWAATGASASGTEEKFGAASLSVTGAQYIGNNDGAVPLLGSGDFTIDFWSNYSTYTGQDFACVNTNNTGAWYFSGPFSGGDLQFGNAGGVPLVSGAAPSTGTWHHIAVVRNSGTLTMYVNGTSVGSASNSTNFNTTGAALVIGGCPLIFTSAAGYIDEFRISSVARWTTNFTPPSSPYAITNTITTNPGSWISSVDGGAGPGECTVNFTGAVFSSAPVCLASPITGTAASSTNPVSAATTSAVSLKSVIGGVAVNNNTYMHCQ